MSVAPDSMGAKTRWLYHRFSDSRLLPLLGLYTAQMVLLLVGFALVPAIGRKITAVLLVASLLAILGAARGFAKPQSLRNQTPAVSESTIAHSSVADAADDKFERFLQALVRVTALDVYGRSLLSPRAASYLWSAALLLLTTTLWQFAATIYVTYQPLTDFFSRPTATILAVAFAAVLTISLGITERSLLTTELTRRIWWMYALHLLVAGAIAIILTTTMTLRLADSVLAAQAVNNRTQTVLTAELAALNKPAALLTRQDLDRLRSIADKSTHNQHVSFVEKLQALHDLEADKIASPLNGGDLVKLGLIHPTTRVAGSLFRRLQWCLFALFWLLPSTNMVARLFAPREVDFYFSLEKQIRYAGYIWHEAVAEDARNAAAPLSASAA